MAIQRNPRDVTGDMEGDQLLWKDLVLPLSSELTANTGGKKQTVDQAAARLEARLDSVKAGVGGLASVAMLIAQAIPEANRTDAIINAIDLMPYLQKISDSKGKVYRAETDGVDMPWLTSGYGVTNMNEVADKYLSVLTGRANDIRKVNGLGPVSAADMGQAGLDVTLKYATIAGMDGATMADVANNLPTAPNGSNATGGTTGGVPAAAPSSGGNTSDEYVPAAAAGTVQQTSFTPESLRNVFRLTGRDLQTVVDSPISNGSNVTYGDLPIEFNATGGTGHVTPRDKAMSAYEALNFLYTMPPAEVRKWEQNMRDAGYYDKVGKQSTMSGDAHEDANRVAWNALLTDAALTGTTVDSTLAKAQIAYLQRQTQTGQGPRFDDLGRERYDSSGAPLTYDANGQASVQKPEVTTLSDPNQIRWDGDYRANQLLKRYLTDDEKLDLINNVHSAETAYQTQAREISKTGGTLTDFDPSTVIDTYVKLKMPIEDADGKAIPWTQDSLRSHLFGGADNVVHGRQSGGRAIDQPAVDRVAWDNAPAPAVHAERATGI